MQLANASCPADAARLELRRGPAFKRLAASRRDDDNDDPRGSGEREGKTKRFAPEMPSGLRISNSRISLGSSSSVH
jgi:hypothetical protein